MSTEPSCASFWNSNLSASCAPDASFTIFFGVLQIASGIGASYISRSVVNDALAIAGFTAGILLGIFGLGALTRRVGQTGAFIGMASGVVVLTFIKFATSVAWPWYAIIGAVATFSVGLLVSWLFRDQSAGAGGTGG